MVFAASQLGLWSSFVCHHLPNCAAKPAALGARPAEGR